MKACAYPGSTEGGGGVQRRINVINAEREEKEGGGGEICSGL